MFLLLFNSCKQEKEAVRHEYHYVLQRDSVFFNNTDTLKIEKFGDTVRIFEKLTSIKYVYTQKNDTLRVRDTLKIKEKAKSATEKVKKTKKNWYKWLIFGFFSGIICIIAVRILIKIYLKK